MPSLKFKIGVNILIQTVGKIIVLIFSSLLTGFLTRYLGPKGYGAYTTVFAYLGFFAIISEFGLGQILVMELAKLKNAPQKSAILLSNILSFRLFLISVSIILAITISLFFPYSPLIRLGIIIASFSHLFIYPAASLMNYFQVKLNFFYIVLADTLGVLITVILSLILILLQGANLLLLITAVVIGSFFTFLTIFIFFHKEKLSLSFSFNLPFWRKIFVLAFPLFLISLLNQFFFRIDIPLLSLISGASAVGIYGLAFKIFEFSIFPASFFTATVFPVLAGKTEEKTAFKKTFKIGVLGLFIMGIIAALLIYFLSPLLIHLFGGKNFFLSVLPLQILTLSIIPLYLSSFLTVSLIIFGQQKKLFYIYLSATIINLTLNLIFIPNYSFIASAWISVVTNSFVALAESLQLRKLFLSFQT